MQKHWDIMFGTVGAVGSSLLAQAHAWLGFATLCLTFIVMCFRLRKEWKNRNKSKSDE